MLGTQDTTATPPYIPQSGDFIRFDGSRSIHTLSRPSLSYWQDAWIRLKKNRRALFSLYLVIALLAFTGLGPFLWNVDPAFQDLSRISQGPSFGSKAVVVEDLGPWNPVADPLKTLGPAAASADSLTAPTNFHVVGNPTTDVIRLQWDAVPGATGYVLYRSNHEPGDSGALGLPLADRNGGNNTFYMDRLTLEAGESYYSVVPVLRGQESENYASLKVEIKQAVSVEMAQSLAPGSKVGDEITLKSHPLGTDYLGRDMLARLMYGARVSLFIGIFAPLFFILLGTLYGGLAGYVGGKLDGVLMRFADFVVALPFLLFMILFRIAFGIGPGESGVIPLLISLVALGWPSTARLVRGQVLQLREEAFVQAAKLLGARPLYLLLRHMVPNTMGVILVTLTFAIPSAIFTEAFLSFIGMGVAPPTPSWGSMCNEGIKTMLSHPHELIFPAVLISITVLAFNLLGDGLRDALDARMRSRE